MIYEKVPPGMFVGEILDAGKGHHANISFSAKLIETAKLLNSGHEIVTVIGPEGIVQGVVTKTDIVRHISNCDGAACLTLVSIAMTRDIVSCGTQDQLADVSRLMKEHRLKNIPVIDEDNRLLGVLTAREILRALLGEVEFEEAQMINYVKGIGYR